MKQKKLIFILMACVVAFGVFWRYNHARNKKATQVQHQDTYSRLTDVSKRNARSGLAQMARALKKYHADNHSYPPDLQKLFPNYIRSKAFIDEINWSYRRRGNSFLLSKTITREGNTLTASIDDALTMQVGTGTMLAKYNAGKSQASSRKPTVVKRSVAALAKTDAVPKKTIGGGMNRTVEKNVSFKSAYGNFASLFNKDFRHKEPIKKPETSTAPSIKLQKVADDIPKIQDKPLNSIGNYLVWKDKYGNLGFGNVQYPDNAIVHYAYIQGQWKAFTE